jgi:hypothetical protein
MPEADRVAVLKSLCGNRWRWGLAEFAKRLDLDPHDQHTKDLFVSFDEAAKSLGSLDDRVLGVISTPAA